MSDIVERCRAAGRDERLSTGALYLEAADEIERLRSQLPEGMKECTILFKECDRGHGSLTATNWVQHPCQQCEIERLRAELRSAIAKAHMETVAERDALRESANLAVRVAYKWQTRADKAEAARDALRELLPSLRRLIAGIAVVGNIDGHDVIRRNSVLELIDRKAALDAAKGAQPNA